MLHLLDTYAAGISLLCSALFECIAVSWFYGESIRREINLSTFVVYNNYVIIVFRIGKIL